VLTKKGIDRALDKRRTPEDDKTLGRKGGSSPITGDDAKGLSLTPTKRKERKLSVRAVRITQRVLNVKSEDSELGEVNRT